MKRTQICLSEKQRELLSVEVKERGVSMAELIRRILDEYFDRKNTQK